MIDHAFWLDQERGLRQLIQQVQAKHARRYEQEVAPLLECLQTIDRLKPRVRFVRIPEA